MSEAEQIPLPRDGGSGSNACPKCGVELPAAAAAANLSQQCPHCLLDLALSDSAQGQSTGSEFGEYRLVRQVGRGAMGVVYEALQVNLGRTVALKMILDANFAHTGLRRRFKIEAEASAKLDHPNIVPVYDFGESEGQAFLSMQFVPGENLKQKSRKGELCLAGKHGEATAIATFMLAVSRAVAHAHDHGVLHRDLKPSNILVDSEGKPHLTDFGLAKIVDAQESATGPGGVVGTLSYMAPEQASGGVSSIAGDVYGLGAVLYEMLTGRAPIAPGTVPQMLKQLTRDPPIKPRTLIKSIPRDLETVCLKCLEKNPSARYPSAEAVAEDLERWLHKRPIRARPIGPILAASRWCRRNPVGTALIVVLCSALASALLVLKSMQTQERESDFLRSYFRDKKMGEIQAMWNDPDSRYIQFTNADLATLMEYYAGFQFDPNALQLTLALEMSGDPIARANDIAPVLLRIEKAMAKSLKRPVAFSLRLQKHRPDVADPIIKGEVDFQRLGPLAYVRARETATNLVLVAKELASDDGVIFTRRQLGISNLAHIVGLRLALAHSNSVVSLCAKLQLASNGISAKQLGSYEHLDPPTTLTGTNSSGSWSGEFFAHSVVIQAVVTNKCDVGDARLHDFERSPFRTTLVVIKQFPVYPKVYVARENLDPTVIAAFQQALLSLNKEQKLLRKFFESASDGFSAVTDMDLNGIRYALTNDIPKFEAHD